MRFICLLILLAVGAVVVIFAMQNQQQITLTFFDRSITANIAVVIGAAYGLGMVSGWTIVGILRRSLARVAEFPAQRRNAAY
jgi:lipopolysaccharide assembly protein A